MSLLTYSVIRARIDTEDGRVNFETSFLMRHLYYVIRANGSLESCKRPSKKQQIEM